MACRWPGQDIVTREAVSPNGRAARIAEGRLTRKGDANSGCDPWLSLEPRERASEGEGEGRTDGRRGEPPGRPRASHAPKNVLRRASSTKFKAVACRRS